MGTPSQTGGLLGPEGSGRSDGQAQPGRKTVPFPLNPCLFACRSHD